MASVLARQAKRALFEHIGSCHMLVVQSLPVGRRRKIPIAFLVIGLLQETVEREAKLLLRRRAGPPYIGMHLQHRIAIATHIRKSDGAQRALRAVKLDR